VTRAGAAASSLLEVGVLIDLSPQEAAVAAGRAAATGVAVVATDRGVKRRTLGSCQDYDRRDDWKMVTRHSRGSLRTTRSPGLSPLGVDRVPLRAVCNGHRTAAQARCAAAGTGDVSLKQTVAADDGAAPVLASVVGQTTAPGRLCDYRVAEGPAGPDPDTNMATVSPAAASLTGFSEYFG
jgi:hypothetical protein